MNKIKSVDDMFEDYWKLTLEGMSDGDFIKYRNLGKSNAKTSFIAGHASAQKEIDYMGKKILIAIDTLSGIACNQFEHPCDQADFALKRIKDMQDE